VNGGHEPPLIIQTDGAVRTLEPTGLPVAMIEDIMLDASEGEIRPGEVLAVFSDGIPEATTTGDDFLGLEPVQDILIASRKDPLRDIRKRIVKSVAEFLGGQSASDDVTLMLLRRLP
jgi:sigma-B regulation protein RsbU (phosphoserine phosphatase)